MCEDKASYFSFFFGGISAADLHPTGTAFEHKQSRSIHAAEARISLWFFGGIEMNHADTNPPFPCISPDLSSTEGKRESERRSEA